VLKIVTTNQFGQKSWDWHLYDGCLDDVSVQHVKEVRADGGELAVILRNISGIPVKRGEGTMSWFGDDAKFIVVAMEAVNAE
jgi:hypothetical protein